MNPKEGGALPEALVAPSPVPSLPSEVEEVLRAIVRALAIEAARSHFKDEHPCVSRSTRATPVICRTPNR
jgi:hypothetical protein